MIKAIETKYNGYRFRSRLEARWAVFFDALEIEYQYEPEGFDLGELGWYLPDFWLPEQKTWIEIKGTKPIQVEVDKVAILCLQSHQKTIILSGDPGIDAKNIVAFFIFSDTDGMPGGDTPDEYLGDCCAAIGHIPIYGDSADFRLGRKDDRELWILAQDYSVANCLNPIVMNRCRWPIIYPRLEQAYRAARSARFEHGESPKFIRR